MKKIICSLAFLAAVLCFSSCGMKECKCYSTNVITQNDSIIQDATDTVDNYTRTSCNEFNKDEVYNMDSVTTVYHSIFCFED